MGPFSPWSTYFSREPPLFHTYNYTYICPQLINSYDFQLSLDFPLPHYAFVRLEMCKIEERTVFLDCKSEVLDYVCRCLKVPAPQRSCGGGISDVENLRAGGVVQEKKRPLYTGYRERVGRMCGDLDSQAIVSFSALSGNVSVSIFVPALQPKHAFP